MTKTIALRIDVDTLRGTSRGVPRLTETLQKHGVNGTFYFSVGPDNMGRHLWRLLKPQFLWKMLRTNAAGLYGPEIILMGTAWPGPNIGKRCGDVIKACIAAGNEAGFHAWDHHRSQAKLMTLSEAEHRRELQRGVDFLTGLLGNKPLSSASPGWRTNETLLKVKEEFQFAYNSDCRGYAPFYPVLNGKRYTLQIPVTLPTYDEAVGRNGVTKENYNAYQLSLLQEDKLNVLTIHAEVEGGCGAEDFDAYLTEVLKRGYRVITLKQAADEVRGTAPEGQLELQPFPGREGLLAVQK